MRVARFDDDRVGIVMDSVLQDVTSALQQLPAHRHPFPRHDALIANLELLSGATSTRTVPLQKAKLLSPVANPGKIMAAPVNYKKHLEEVLADKGIHHGNLISEIHKAGLFLKASSSVAGPGEGVQLVHRDRRNDHEVELAVVIGMRGRDITAAEALSHVAGYCIGLDMTIRGPEERSFRKSPDSYTVLGPWLVTADEIPDPGSLAIEISVNGKVKQEANTKDLILGVAQLIEWASSFYTLHPGDVLLTGTPQGVGPVRPGDVMEASLERVGSMRVEVK
ncbi:MAG: 5-carboxymethyl-2-hydroxymuconate delta-isomerase [Burkholderiales bacterium]|jgi:2-keto-4-pentenoate hydratase/2-oxohepta-3-ene-1,7-dioic acid hydratase in catechol pathway|nr:5-carboxymethyl-2-hydroxymuconate delta-isomerase [Burkholderiales bacterium]